MRKPLTLFETLIAAFLAAILFSNLLSTFFRLSKAKGVFSHYKESILQQADLHIRLKELVAECNGNFSEDTFYVQDDTFYFKNIPLALGITSFHTEIFYKKQGYLTKTQEWEKQEIPYALRLYINKIPYVIQIGGDKEGFEVCR